MPAYKMEYDDISGKEGGLEGDIDRLCAVGLIVVI